MTVKQVRDILARYNEWETVCICVQDCPDSYDEWDTGLHDSVIDPEIEPELFPDGRCYIAFKCDYNDLGIL